MCGSSLDNARGVFVCVIVDGWAVFDVIPVPIVCSTGVLGLRGVGFGFGVEVSSVALGVGGVVGVSNFLTNRQFLKMILPDPSTLTRYWWLGSLDNLTCCVPLAGCWLLYCHYLHLLKGHKVYVVLLYCSMRRAFRQDRIISRFFPAAIQSACGLKSVVSGWYKVT